MPRPKHRPVPSLWGLISVSREAEIIHTYGKRSVLNQTWDKRWGWQIQFNAYGTRYIRYVHRVVAEVWVHNPNPEEYKFVHRWDGDKHNNHANNLYWWKKNTRLPFKEKPLVLADERDDMIEYVCKHVQVDDETKCWNWIYKTDRAKFKNRRVAPWKLPYALWKGYVWPNTAPVMSCGNDRCINPDHVIEVRSRGRRNYAKNRRI